MLQALVQRQQREEEARVVADQDFVQLDDLSGEGTQLLETQQQQHAQHAAALQQLSAQLQKALPIDASKEEQQAALHATEQEEQEHEAVTEEIIEKLSGNRPSIVVNGRELNPDKYVLNNPYMADNIAKLYRGLVEKLGHSNFQFQVTGGDRYIGKDGKIYSKTNDSLIPEANKYSAHVDKWGARAVDFRIKLADGSDIIPRSIVEKAVAKTLFIFDEHALPEDYKDRHYHLQLPNTKKYGGGQKKK